MRRWVLAHQWGLGIGTDLVVIVTAALLAVGYSWIGSLGMAMWFALLFGISLYDLAKIVQTGKVLWFR